MTIEFKGHVHALEFVGAGKVQVEIRVEASRTTIPIKLLATAGETECYRPGTAILVQIRPSPESESAL